MNKIIQFFVVSIIILFVILPFCSIFIEFDNLMSWKFVMKDFKTYNAIMMTILVALLSLVINILIGTPAAEVLARYHFRGKGMIIAVLMLPFIIPGFITSMGLQYSFIKFNLIENIWGVVLIHSLYTLPYYIRAVIVGFQTISKDYEYMGWVYGASGYKNFFYITFPQILPAILVGSGLVLTVSFAQYLNTLIIGGGKIVTIPIMMFPYISNGNITVGSVFASVFVVVNLLLIIFTEIIIKLFLKYTVKG